MSDSIHWLLLFSSYVHAIVTMHIYIHVCFFHHSFCCSCQYMCHLCTASTFRCFFFFFPSTEFRIFSLLSMCEHIDDLGDHSSELWTSHSFTARSASKWKTVSINAGGICGRRLSCSRSPSKINRRDLGVVLMLPNRAQTKNKEPFCCTKIHFNQ